MKWKVSVLICIFAAAILGCLSTALLFAQSPGESTTSASLYPLPPPRGADRSSALPAPMDLVVTTPDNTRWPESLLYLLVGAVLIGISVATRQIERLRRRTPRMRKLSEISDLKVLAMSPPKQAVALEHDSKHHQHDRIARHG